MDSNYSLLFWVAVAVIVILWLAYRGAKTEINQLRIQMTQRVQQETTAWRERELDSERKRLSALADAEAAAKLETWMLENERTFREDAVRRAQAVLSGKVTEHLAPYLPDFPYDPRDVRFLGTPVDLIVFDGMAENDLREIVFLEVKTGSSRLTKRERDIRHVILQKCVSWDEFRLPKDGVPAAEAEIAEVGSIVEGCNEVVEGSMAEAADAIGVEEEGSESKEEFALEVAPGPTRYLVVVERGENSFGAYAPDLPGCGVAGETLEEALGLMREAITLHLERLREEGKPIPEPLRPPSAYTPD